MLLVLLIVLSSLLRTPKKAAVVKNIQTKSVNLYSIGSVPKAQVQAQIKKSGVVRVVALTGGVVQSVNFHEGDPVEKGSTLF